MEHDDQFADEHDFCCGKPRACPIARIDREHGGVSVWEGSRGDEPVRFTEEQARDLYKWLKAKGFDR